MEAILNENLFKIKDGWIITNGEEIKVDDYYVTYDTAYFPPRHMLYSRVTECNGTNPRKAVATMGCKIEGLPSIKPTAMYVEKIDGILTVKKISYE